MGDAGVVYGLNRGTEAAGAFVDDAPDDACGLTVARAGAAEPCLWQDLARQWLGAPRLARHAAPDDAGVCVSAPV